MQDQASAEFREPEPLRINKIHFLIHPGFINDWGEKEGRTTDNSLSLLKRYEEKANTLAANELMLVFTHTGFDELKEDIKAGKNYAETIRKMKKTLGKRMIMISGDFDMFDSPQAFQKVLKTVEGRGYNFDQDVESFAYGETMGECVRTGAENLNRNAGLSKKTVVIPELTDFALYTPEETAGIRNYILTNVHETPRVSFDNI